MTFRIASADHVTLAVSDVAAAVAFFALFGFREDHVARIDGGVPAAYMGMPSMRADHITLVLDGEPRFEIQLLHFDDGHGDVAGSGSGSGSGSGGVGGSTTPSNLCRRGFNHLALRVDDLDAAAAHLLANGVRALNEPMTFISRRLAFFEGPEGVTIELVQALEPPA